MSLPRTRVMFLARTRVQDPDGENPGDLCRDPAQKVRQARKMRKPEVLQVAAWFPMKYISSIKRSQWRLDVPIETVSKPYKEKLQPTQEQERQLDVILWRCWTRYNTKPSTMAIFRRPR